MGTTQVPAEPKRVVVLDTGELDTAITLGVTPVGAVRAPVEDGLLDYLAEKTAGVELVGAIAEPNLEVIAGLKPDLILSSKVREEARYEALSRIAPTVFSETPSKWKENFHPRSR
jgi:iron complex transport system substrate-binding protein